MPVLPIESLDKLEPFLAEGSSAFLLKHSTRCPISARAQDEVDRYSEANPEVPIHRVLVVEQRAISLEIAARLGVTHASPQIILVRDGAAVWNASHRGVTEEALSTAWSR